MRKLKRLIQSLILLPSPLFPLCFPLFQCLWRFYHFWQSGRHFFKVFKVQRQRGKKHSLLRVICTKKNIEKFLITFSHLPFPLKNKPGSVRMAHQGGCLHLVFVLLRRAEARAGQMGAVRGNGDSPEPALPKQRTSTGWEVSPCCNPEFRGLVGVCGWLP